MELVTHGLLGALLVQCLCRKQKIRILSLIGFIAAIIGESLRFVTDKQDPLAALEYQHSLFHSLFLVPVIALLLAIFFYILLLRKHDFGDCYVASLLGYLSYIIMAACGVDMVRLFWPLHDELVGWGFIAGIDIVLTLLLMLFVTVAFWRKSNLLAILGFSCFLIYLLLAVWQQEKVKGMLSDVIKSRNHLERNVIIIPTEHNLLVWRTIYRTGGYYMIDAIRMPILDDMPLLYKGVRIPAFQVANMFPEIAEDSVLRNDIKRFSAITDGYVYIDHRWPDLLLDLRYSFIPNGLSPYYGIRVNNVKQGDHAQLEYLEPMKGSYQKFRSMFYGE